MKRLNRKAKPYLKKLGACVEALDWVGKRTIEEAWNDCPKGDWMLWAYAKTYPEDIRGLTLAKGHCVNTVRHLMKDKRSRDGVDAAIAFGEGRIKLKKLEVAHIAANIAANYTAAIYAIDAAYPAIHAIDAAYAAMYATYTAATNASIYAIDAAHAVTTATADAITTMDESKMEMANICRIYLRIN